MKKIFLFIVVLFISLSCSDKSDTDIFYIDEDVVIRQSNESEGFTQDKFHKPMIVGMWLVESVKHPGNFMEMSTYGGDITKITKENWYTKKKGDTLHFDYIRKEHYFKLNK